MATCSPNSNEKEGANGAAAAELAASIGASREADAGEELPRVLGRYVLLRRIARGGMGEVFLGSTTGLEGAERPVVVKIIRREHVKDPSFIARFLDEARVQAQLHHSGVAQVLEASTCEASGEPFAVIEHVEGKSLGDVRARALQIGQRITWADAVAVVTMIAEALAHVHERQDAAGRALSIVHRDLSPQNVMLSFAGDVKIIDFGTARGQNRRCRTVAGVVFAKPGYVAPEVANGDSGDSRVDVYALGIMLWELCAGRRFLQGDAGAHMASVARNQNHPPKIAASCGAPIELDGIIAKLTAFDREARYSESRVVACDLAKLLTDAPALPMGERGVRARASRLMQSLFPSEPSRSRREFVKLVASAQVQMKAAVAASRRSSPLPPPPPSKVAAELALPDLGPSIEGPMSEGARLGEVSVGSLLPGTRYKLIREMGRGASSVVYEAEHVDLGRRVAVKVLSSAHAGVKEFATRFRREARALSLLSHEGLVKIMDFGQAADGRLFCVMELLDGETLEDRLTRDRRIDWREALGIAVKALAALNVAHEAHIIHRDIKPANMFLTKGGGLKLLDFGLAKALHQPPAAMLPESDLDRKPAAKVAAKAEGEGPVEAKAEGDGDGEAKSDGEGEAQAHAQGHGAEPPEELTKRAGLTILGTPEYMAPEQASVGEGDPRSDVYGMGCVIYEMLTGSLPFEGSSPIALLAAKIKGSPERPSERAPMLELPRMVDDLVMRALARHPVVRFQTASEMRLAMLGAIQTPLAKRAIRRAFGLAAFTALMAFATVLVVGQAGPMRRAVVGWIGPQRAPSTEVMAQAEAPSAPIDGSGAALAANMKPLEADPVNIGPDLGGSANDEEGAAGAPSDDEEPIAEGGDAAGEDGENGEDDANEAAPAANKQAAHQVLPIVPTSTRARHRSRHTESGARASNDAKASAPSKAGDPKATDASSKHASKGESKGSAPSSGASSKSSKASEVASAPVKGERAKEHDLEPEEDPPAAPAKTAANAATPSKASAQGAAPSKTGDQGAAPSKTSAHGLAPSKTSAPATALPKSDAQEKTARKQHGPRRKKKSRVAHKSE